MDGSDIERAVRLNHEVFLRTGDRILDLLATHGLTHATAHALWAIDPDEPPPSMKVMAERLFCNAPNLTFVAGQLIAKGLAERAVDPSDRRSRVLVLTEEGTRVRTEVMRVTLERTPFANLDHGQIATLIHLLDTALGTPHEN
ncbi:MarR family transcriptional regulator [Umezawaea sp. Da 62-37]|uniref:MarR family winged helix-turn-helix transcriptional regulator n=1 Tax=Umezawaea sp. Da 62-37 TaxID=3075927 RepID=UPI0028F73702|nr:MarR family transcriptional regulator [Umezawaea sp. Da 62-37]WNV86250.1 hypothetical protein RM788_50430 [Umezawaea sp. Da 62-37]